MKIREAYTFDDLMLVPEYSEIESRKQPDTSTVVGHRIEIPIIASPMNTVTEAVMADTMTKLGADAVLHRYMSIEEQCKQFQSVKRPPWAAVGASGDFAERAQALYDAGVRKFCIDVANGHSKIAALAVHNLRYLLGEEVYIMAGNVCTAEGARVLEANGANVIRVGIGPGSQCTTRLVTGFGVPQLSAIGWCAGGVKLASIVADGGIRSSGDIVKALAMGADAVMIGGLIAGTDECPGEVVRDEETGQLFKYYHGMASREGREDWFGREVSSYVPEGVSTKVPHRGEAKKIVENLNSSLKVGMSFANAKSIKELQQNAKWVKVTDNGRKEANPNKRLFK
jgi:IMP dehydrogenase